MPRLSIPGRTQQTWHPRCARAWEVRAPARPSVTTRSIGVQTDLLVKKAGLSARVHLALGIGQALGDLVLGFRPPPAQPLLELLKARRRDEDELGVQVGLLDQLGALHVYVEEARLARGPHVLHALDGRAVDVGVHARCQHARRDA